MKVQQIDNGAALRPQKPSARDTPHATIEPNTTCNIRCRLCYSIEEPEVKPLDQVLREIDFALARRRLTALSLLGGEPTLHPQICEIVRYVKSKGLVCQVLTNAVFLLRDNNTALLDALVRAGVDRFLVHLDRGQEHVHGDIDLARERAFSALDARKVNYGLSLTLYPGDEHAISTVMRRYAKHPYFDGVLCTLPFDAARFERPDDPRTPEMIDVYRAVGDELDLQPAAYLPSSLDDDEVCWLMYFYFIDAESGATFGLSPGYNRALKSLYHLVARRDFFAPTLAPRMTPASFAGSLALELSLHPRRLREAREFVHQLAGASSLRFHYIVVQQPPRYEPVHGKVQICWQCPDASVRNGAFTPVCIASRIRPLGGRRVKAPAELVDQVLGHLR